MVTLIKESNSKESILESISRELKAFIKEKVRSPEYDEDWTADEIAYDIVYNVLEMMDEEEFNNKFPNDSLDFYNNEILGYVYDVARDLFGSLNEGTNTQVFTIESQFGDFEYNVVAASAEEAYDKFCELYEKDHRRYPPSVYDVIISDESGLMYELEDEPLDDEDEFEESCKLKEALGDDERVKQVSFDIVVPEDADFDSQEFYEAINEFVDSLNYKLTGTVNVEDLTDDYKSQGYEI